MLARGFLKGRMSLPGFFRGQRTEIRFREPLPASGEIVILPFHDLRIVLNAVLAGIGVLTLPTLSEIQRRVHYREFRRAVDGMNEVVSSLVEYSKETDDPDDIR
jgi:hypothetical protein